MRLIGNLLLALVVLVFFNSCFDAPHFPVTPEIEYNGIIFRKGLPTTLVPTPSDTLILTVNFKDGDGDLGVGVGDSTNIKYVNRIYYQFFDKSFVTYKTKRTDPRYDTLPDFVRPYTCTNWEITYNYDSAEPKPLDTLYFQLNPNYYNIFIDIYVQQADGNTFKKFDWLNEFPGSCLVGGLNGRFPVLSKDLSVATVQEGKIRYSMPSAVWLILFSIKPLYLNVYIQDRALHKSKPVSTPVFTLQSIQK